MTNAQLYLTIGIPTFAILIGILVNQAQISSLGNSMNSRFQGLEGRIQSLENRITALEQKIDAKIDLLIGKILGLDNRLTRLEERLKH